LRAARLRVDRGLRVIPGFNQRAVVVDHIISDRAGSAYALPNLRSLCRYHDLATKERPSGKRLSGGIMRGCHANGSPVDPAHLWFKS